MRERDLGKIVLVVSLLAFVAGIGAAAEGVVNVNSAGLDQLTLLPRVGPVVAQRILDHRKEHGEFREVEDLLLVEGIGEKTFELLRPHVAISGKTTLTEKVRVPAGETAGEG